MRQDEEQIKAALERSAKKLDGVDVAVPDFIYFKNMVNKQQAAVRRAQKRQLALFVVVAVVILSAVICLTGISGAFLLALQGAAFAGGIAGLAVFAARTRRLKEGTR